VREPYGYGEAPGTLELNRLRGRDLWAQGKP
jgi:hypothetical protein